MINSVYDVFFTFYQDYIFVNMEEYFLNLIAGFTTFLFFFSVIVGILGLLRIGGKNA